MNKNSPQNPPAQLKSCEIDFDDSPNTTIIDHTNEQISTSSNKYQRSKSVDTRARLQLSQLRSNNDLDDNTLSNNDEQQRTVLSSKFTSINPRQPPSRAPLTPRTSLTKRSSNGVRTPNFYDTDHHHQQQQVLENEENISLHDENYSSKLNENRTRTSIPVHRYTTNNNIQPSPSTSSVQSTTSRAKPPISMPINFERRDSNGSFTDSNRFDHTLHCHMFIKNSF